MLVLLGVRGARVRARPRRGRRRRIGYLLKDRVGDIEDFAAAIRRVAHGGTALEPTVVELMVSVSARAASTRRQRRRAAGDPTRWTRSCSSMRSPGRATTAAASRAKVRDGFVAVTPDGRHSRHTHYYQALEWFDDLGVESAGGG